MISEGTMTVYLIRHGVTDWNRAGRLQGLEDIPLNAEGLRDAAECARILKPLPVDFVASSPLLRAKMTAEILARALGVPLGVDERLIERDFGRLSGLFPEERAAFLAAGQDPGSEPLEAVADRMLRALDELARRHGRLLAVSHGASINAVLARLSGGEIGSGKTLLINTGVSRLSFRGGLWRVDFYNAPADKALELARELDGAGF